MLLRPCLLKLCQRAPGWDAPQPHSYLYAAKHWLSEKPLLKGCSCFLYERCKSRCTSVGRAVRDQWGSVTQQDFQCQATEFPGMLLLPWGSCCPGSQLLCIKDGGTCSPSTCPFPLFQRDKRECSRVLWDGRGSVVRILTGKLRQPHPSADFGASSLWLLSSKALRSAWFWWELGAVWVLACVSVPFAGK